MDILTTVILVLGLLSLIGGTLFYICVKDEKKRTDPDNLDTLDE